MKRIFVEYQDDPKTLIDHLEANADKVVEDYHYIREMTMAERVELEARYIELSKKVDALADEFKVIKEEFDGKINPLKKQMVSMINILVQRVETLLELMKEGREFVSINEASELLGFHKHAVYNAIYQGRIEKHRVKGRVFIKVDDLTQLMK